ncbi:MAG: PaaI family thioesterase [Bacteroidota bacterium]
MAIEENISCFACGSANPIGLGVVFRSAGEGVCADYTPSCWHQGYDGVVHGGLIATVLDEAMAHALIARGIPAVTARMSLRYHAPLALGVTAQVTAWVDAARGRLAETRAEIRAGGRLIAEAEAVFALPRDQARPERRGVDDG